jgi:hypothetical protein
MIIHRDVANAGETNLSRGALLQELRGSGVFLAGCSIVHGVPTTSLPMTKARILQDERVQIKKELDSLTEYWLDLVTIIMLDANEKNKEVGDSLIELTHVPQ